MLPATVVRHDVTRLTEEDIYLFAEGTHTRLYEKLGSHPMTVDAAPGTYFAVWAPEAERVSVVGDFNGWDREAHPLAPRGASGLWEGFVPGVGHGAVYKYFIASKFRGYGVEKADPFAFRQETPPRTASVVWHGTPGGRGGASPRARRPTTSDKPVSIYEVHLGSFRRIAEEENRSLGYRELAVDLAEHASRMGFTHVELMPVMEHPFGGSWGYQITGYFAPSSRFGDPEDFLFLIEALHEKGLGVILDWVPSHFPSDEHGLGYFDGTYLYEHADPRKGYHPDWKSLIFNYGRPEVMSFLLSNAHFWLDRYRIDGLRVDAVASMLYLDYSRKHGEWIPNRHGGRENLEAIDFLRRLNDSITRAFPDASCIAEESTSWPMVSRPAYVGGLGFQYKWDMGWMNDTLKYMSSDPVHRKYVHNQLTFRMMYAFSESFVLPISHDEVVHGKGSLLGKMPGDEWQKFANLRLLFSYMWSQPGKKLLFMGCEIGQKREWNHDGGIDWHLRDEGPYHVGLERFVRAMNRLYVEKAAMHELDTHPEGFQWIDCNDSDHSIVVFYRRARSTDTLVLAAFNFTPIPRPRYRVGLPRGGRWKEILSSDAIEFGGSGAHGGGDFVAETVKWHDRQHSFEISLPPLGAVFFQQDGLAVSERPLGAVCLGEDRVCFRVWAPRAPKVELVLSATEESRERRILLSPEEGGYHQSTIDGVSPGARYRFDIGEGRLRPDPASRLQPEGVHGPSEVVERFRDQTPGYSGRPLDQYVLYELHVGAFTDEGTLDAALSRLPELRALGITAIELMPLSAFPGERNWGYDGAFPFSVHAAYGGPAGLRRFVDACHAENIAVVLDVVYNHLGPEGTYLADFGPYFSSFYRTHWGEALNFDGPQSDEVRKFFLESALYFITELGIDALRLDAVGAIVDTSARSFLEELGEAVHRRASELGRPVHLIAESDENDPRLLEPTSRNGLGLDGCWNDDVHYALMALVTGERAGFLQDFGPVERLAKAFRENYSYTGEPSAFLKRRRGRLGGMLEPRRLVVCAQNHDQVGNRPRGDRLPSRVSHEKRKLAAAVVLLSPFLPLIFMGEEYGETAPFPYFTSFGDTDLAAAVRDGRRRDLDGRGLSGADALDPEDPETFRAAILDWRKRDQKGHASQLAFYRELLRLRRETPALSAEAGREALAFEEERVLFVRRFGGGGDVFLAYHFGETPVTVSLPVSAGRYTRLLSSAEARFDGPGTHAADSLSGAGMVRLTLGPAEAAVYSRIA